MAVAPGVLHAPDGVQARTGLQPSCSATANCWRRPSSGYPRSPGSLSTSGRGATRHYRPGSRRSAHRPPEVGRRPECGLRARNEPLTWPIQTWTVRLAATALASFAPRRRPWVRCFGHADPLIEHETVPHRTRYRCPFQPCSRESRRPTGTRPRSPARSSRRMPSRSGCRRYRTGPAGGPGPGRVHVSTKSLNSPNVAVFAHFAPRNVPMSDS